MLRHSRSRNCKFGYTAPKERTEPHSSLKATTLNACCFAISKSEPSLQQSYCNVSRGSSSEVKKTMHLTATADPRPDLESESFAVRKHKIGIMISSLLTVGTVQKNPCGWLPASIESLLAPQ